MTRSKKSDDMPDQKTAPHKTPFPKGLAQPALRALAGENYDHFEQLSTITEASIKELHGIGPNALSKLRDALNEIGLSFADP